MIRVKRGAVARLRRKKILYLSKSYKGAHSRLFRTANQQVMKALHYATIGRKQKKRVFRKIWIFRLNKACQSAKINYSTLISQFKKSKIYLNRKMLSQLSILDYSTFIKLIEIVK